MPLQNNKRPRPLFLCAIPGLKLKGMQSNIFPAVAFRSVNLNEIVIDFGDAMVCPIINKEPMTKCNKNNVVNNLVYMCFKGNETKLQTFCNIASIVVFSFGINVPENTTSAVCFYDVEFTSFSKTTLLQRELFLTMFYILYQPLSIGPWRKKIESIFFLHDWTLPTKFLCLQLF